MTFERMRCPSSTTAEAVSSQELSIPKTSIEESALHELGEALSVGCACDADFGNDCRDELVRGHVKRGVKHGHAFRDNANRSDMGHFCWSALLDGNMGAIGNRQIQRR